MLRKAHLASRRRALGVVAILALSPSTAPRAEPSDQTLVLGGLALILPTYGLGVMAHEGSHALAAKLVGAEVTVFRPWPGRDPASGAFQFGLTRVRGLSGDGDRLWFYFAPKLTDVLLLGGYLGWFESSRYPASSVGHLVVTVLATGVWIDFAKDTLAFSRHNDLVKASRILGLDNEWKRFPVRLAFAAASAGLGWVVWRGHDRLFASNDTPPAAPVMLSFMSARF